MGALCSTGVKQMDDEANKPLAAQPRRSVNYAPYPEDYDPPFPVQVVGTFSNHGIEPDFDNHAIVKTNQDRGSVDFPFNGNPEAALFCCLDGHGREGDKVSQYAVESIHKLLEKNEAGLATDPHLAFKEAFETTDEKLRRSDINSRSSGSSAVAVYMLKDKLWIANAGDSRAVIGKKVGSKIEAEDLTWDQKPDSDGERERILSMGGRVTPPEDVGLSARVWTANGQYGLSMSRSIGDHMLANHGVIATPVVEQRDVKANDEFMILATDGIWEFIDSDEAVAIVAKYDNATEACYDLIHTATQLWRKEEGDYRDDITALVIFLPKLKPHMKPLPVADDIFSPTSKDLRTKKTTIFKDGESLPGSTMSPDSGPEPRSPMAKGAKASEKAKTFRKRRLSMTPLQKDLIAAANKQHQEDMKEEEPVPPLNLKERKRRLSISPDMDQTGKALNPKGMGPGSS